MHLALCTDAPGQTATILCPDVVLCSVACSVVYAIVDACAGMLLMFLVATRREYRGARKRRIACLVDGTIY